MTNKKYGTNRGSGKIVDLVVILVDLLEILVGGLLGSWWIFWDLGGSFGDLAGSFGDLGGYFGDLDGSFGYLGGSFENIGRSFGNLDGSFGNTTDLEAEDSTIFG